jgi:hypothetical protein
MGNFHFQYSTINNQILNYQLVKKEKPNHRVRT